MTTLATHRLPVARLAYGALAALLLAALVLKGTWTPALIGLIGPDIALAFGGGSGLERGQLHPRAVGFYNLLHRFWLPALLLPLGGAWLVIGLAWAAHVAVDRAMGYGLRDAAGHQR
jgi:hypothetical protein